MQIELLHRYDLTISSASGATFNAEGRAHTWLSDICKCNLVQMTAKSLGESHSRSRFSPSKGCRRNSTDQDVFAIPAMCQTRQEAEVNLRLVRTVWFKLMRSNSDLPRHLGDLLGMLRS